MEKIWFEQILQTQWYYLLPYIASWYPFKCHTQKNLQQNLELQFCLSMRDIWGNHKISVSIFANEKKMLFARIYFWELQVNYAWSKQQSFWSNEWDHKWLKYAKFRKNKTKPSFKLNCLSYQKYSFFKYELENVQS